jgi:hypothetical protein
VPYRLATPQAKIEMTNLNSCQEFVKPYDKYASDFYSILLIKEGFKSDMLG